MNLHPQEIALRASDRGCAAHQNGKSNFALRF
jgi:hypothetical protein